MHFSNKKKSLSILALIVAICFILSLSGAAFSLSAPAPSFQEKAQKTIKPFGFVSKKNPDKLEKTQSDIGTGISIYINDTGENKTIESLDNKIEGKSDKSKETKTQEPQKTTAPKENKAPTVKENKAPVQQENKAPAQKESKAPAQKEDKAPSKAPAAKENKAPDKPQQKLSVNTDPTVQQEQRRVDFSHKDKEAFKKRAEEMKAAFDQLNDNQKKEIYALDNEMAAIKEKILLKYAEFGVITKEEALKYNAKMKEFRQKAQGAKAPGLKSGKGPWKKAE